MSLGNAKGDVLFEHNITYIKLRMSKAYVEERIKIIIVKDGKISINAQFQLIVKHKTCA